MGGTMTSRPVVVTWPGHPGSIGAASSWDRVSGDVKRVP